MKLYDELKEVSISEAVLIIADYSYKSAFVMDQEINLLACVVHLMENCEFK
jgi:replication factor C small subunit